MGESGESPSEISYEEQLKNLFVTSPDIDVDTVVKTANSAFDEVLGLDGTGLEVWNTITLPQALEVYAGSNPTKLARKLSRVIDTAGSQRGEPATIDYLKTAISQDEVAFSRSDKEANTRELVSDIEEFISENAKNYGSDYKGVVAIVIWGSYARFQQRLDSDIDFSTISNDDADGFSHGDRWVSSEDIEESLRKRLKETRKYVAETQIWNSASLTDELSIRNLIEIETPEFIVASPFPVIKERVQQLLEQAIEDGSQPEN